MTNGYSLSPRKARACRIAGAIFLFLAAGTMLGAISVAVAPGPTFDCARGGCRWTLEPTRLLDDDRRAEVTASPARRMAFDRHVARAPVRLGLLGATLLAEAPFAALLLGVGVALRRLGNRGGDPLADALPWLRRASVAAMVAAVAAPLGDSLTKSLLSRATPEGAHWYISLDLAPIGNALMLAAAAYATVWALEAGLKAQRDLAEIV